METIGDGLNEVFSKLQELERFRTSDDFSLLKDKIRRALYNIPSNNETIAEWEKLPNFILFSIALKCGSKKTTYQNLSSVCKSWNHSLNNQTLWKSASVPKFEKIGDIHRIYYEGEPDWKKFYLDFYVGHKILHIYKYKLISLQRNVTTLFDEEWEKSWTKRVLYCPKQEEFIELLVELHSKLKSAKILPENDELVHDSTVMVRKLLERNVDNLTPAFRSSITVWRDATETIPRYYGAISSKITAFFWCIKDSALKVKFTSYSTPPIAEIDAGLIEKCRTPGLFKSTSFLRFKEWESRKDDWRKRLTQWDKGSKDIKMEIELLLELAGSIKPEYMVDWWKYFAPVWKIFKLEREPEWEPTYDLEVPKTI